MGKIINVEQLPVAQTTDIITIDQIVKKKAQRRRRVAKRMYKRFPLFAAEFMQDEFPGYQADMLFEDARRRTKKQPSKFKKKSPMKRQGRYPLMIKELSDYDWSKDIKHLLKAQRLRNLLFQPWRIEYRLGREAKEYRFPSEASFIIIKELASLKFKTWAELDEKIKDITRYGFRG